jgi:hypothetical protein
MAAEGFQIFVSDLSSSAEEWRRALTASDSELPELTEEQRKWANRFGVAEREYARGLLAAQLGQERTKAKGRALGKLAQEMLDGLGSGYKLIAVLWQGSRSRWLLRVETPSRICGVPVPFEMADDILASDILGEIEHLRLAILAGVGRNDLIAGRS